MAERRVRTVEGARLFGVPIGTVIEDRTSPDIERTQRPMTQVRLQSLQRQFAIAKKTGNLDMMRDIQEQFTVAVKEYSTSNQLLDNLKGLVAARGRADQAIGKKKNQTD